VPLFTYRAQLKSRNGDVDGARADVETALRLGGETHSALLLAGDALNALGDYAQARRRWRGALYALPQEETAVRKALLVRLAGLEERHGEPAAALRLWRSVLALDPDHEEASRRIDRLLGGRR
jgi:tetratricopeptide (TPR) repeat protein